MGGNSIRAIVAGSLSENRRLIATFTQKEGAFDPKFILNRHHGLPWRQCLLLSFAMCDLRQRPSSLREIGDTALAIVRNGVSSCRKLKVGLLSMAVMDVAIVSPLRRPKLLSLRIRAINLFSRA